MNRLYYTSKSFYTSSNYLDSPPESPSLKRRGGCLRFIIWFNWRRPLHLEGGVGVGRAGLRLASLAPTPQSPPWKGGEA